MARGRNPDGTPKRYPGERKRRHVVPEIVPVPAAPLTRDDPPVEHRAAADNHWTRNPAILSRLEVVEAYRLAGNSANETARILGLPYDAVAHDYVRLNELWLARVGRTQEALRAEAVRKLDVVIREGLAVLRQDEAYTQAVLFDMPTMVTCNGRQEHRTDNMLMADPLGQPAGTAYGEVFSCIHSHPMLKRLHLDEKGSAQYRRVAGQVLQAVNGAIMNQARILGLVVEKKSLTDNQGNDLPTALKDILLGEYVAQPEEPAALPEPVLDVGLT